MNTGFYFMKRCSFRSLITVTICLLMVRCYLEIAGTVSGTKQSHTGTPNDIDIGNSHLLSTSNSYKYYCDTTCLERFSQQLNKLSTDWSVWNYDKMTECPNLNVAKVQHNNFPRFMDVKCETTESKIGNEIQVIPYGSDCLDHYIEAVCKDNMAVPNIVNYVWYGIKHKFNFYGFISFISVIRFVRPCAILIHGDILPSGPYWDFILNLYPNIIHVQRAIESKTIFGQKAKHRNHLSDVFRIEALLRYGGIYLDMDMVLVKEIDFLRRYPCTMSRMRPNLVASSFIISEKNSSFLNKWLNGYKYHYRNDSYIYSAMAYPSKLAQNYTDLIHIQKETLSRPWKQRGDRIYHSNFNWSSIFGMHLYSRLNLDTVNEKVIRHLNTSFGAIARHILFGNKELCRKKS